LTLIDSNILIDILGGDAKWSAHSTDALAACAKRGPVAINDVIYAELAAGFESRELLDAEIEVFGLAIARLSRDGLHLAGQAFRQYRLAGGTRTNVLADFFIGAQARAEGWPILTRDARRYQTYFPDVALVGVGG